MQAVLYDSEGIESGKMSLSKDIFAVPMNEHVVHQASIWYLASRRQGNHSAKTRTEVSGGGVKPWKQKGTGRARAGSSRSPLWRGGGVIFPPKPRDHSYALPKKVRKLALRVVLSDRAQAGKVVVVEGIKMAGGKTKEMVKFLGKLGVAGNTLFIVDNAEENVKLSARNIAGVKLISPGELTIHDLLQSQWILADKGAIEKLTEVLK